ncbi:hypothetical protein PR048_005071 [Dryococelus australis]|uniref:Uncharacterized protein n=1 Tax=Dryococelus australis TaxID=614101 RepID=A0ABQ9I826_9NEOP|nr:hypothetical protein PR048_005071 [Dryococelus australis]
MLKCYINFVSVKNRTKAIFNRYKPNYNVKSSKYLGYRESKAYNAVVEDKPYENYVEIEKLK